MHEGTKPRTIISVLLARRDIVSGGKHCRVFDKNPATTIPLYDKNPSAGETCTFKNTLDRYISSNICISNGVLYRACIHVFDCLLRKLN